MREHTRGPRMESILLVAADSAEICRRASDGDSGLPTVGIASHLQSRHSNGAIDFATQERMQPYNSIS